MLPFVRLTAPLLFAVLAANASGADFDAADYHAAQCTRCHDSGVYTRENRRVRSYPQLEAQVARCDANLATKLFPNELELLVEHLNTQYYLFAK
jgi:hypothetical protein